MKPMAPTDAAFAALEPVTVGTLVPVAAADPVAVAPEDAAAPDELLLAAPELDFPDELAAATKAAMTATRII